MARDFKISAACAAAMLGDAATYGLAGHLAGGRLRVYEGTPPASCADPLGAATLLVTFTLPSPAFLAATGNSLTARPISSALAAASGTASFFRGFTQAGDVACQGTAGEAGDNCDATLDNKVIVTGALAAVTEWVITQYMG
jgi:hypothetical protein